MVEVFITDIPDAAQATRITLMLEHAFPDLSINIDLAETPEPFPCGHSILRAEGPIIIPQKVIALVTGAESRCEVLEDKVCGDMVTEPQ